MIHTFLFTYESAVDVQCVVKIVRTVDVDSTCGLALGLWCVAGIGFGDEEMTVGEEFY